MRVISGKFKGRKLFAPEDNEVRPTTDRIKETLFNIISSKIGLEEITVLDLFGAAKLHGDAVNQLVENNVDKHTAKQDGNVDQVGRPAAPADGGEGNSKEMHGKAQNRGNDEREGVDQHGQPFVFLHVHRKQLTVALGESVDRSHGDPPCLWNGGATDCARVYTHYTTTAAVCQYVGLQIEMFGWT